MENDSLTPEEEAEIERTAALAKERAKRYSRFGRNRRYSDRHNVHYDEVDIDNGAKISQKNYEDAPVVVTWNHRRRMAWVSLVAILLLTIGITTELIPLNRVMEIQDILSTILWCLFGVIASYMGFTSIPWFGKGRM